MRRRWRQLVAGAAATVLVLVLGVAGWFVLSRGDHDEVEQVVADYLAAVRGGDATAALAYVDADPLAEASDDLLVDRAMTDDWEVTQLVRRTLAEQVVAGDSADGGAPDVRTSTVDVTITATDGTASQGRFALVEQGDGWRLRNPLVKLDLSHGPLAFVDFQGVTSRAETVWLFPGAYEVYPSMAGLVDPLPTYVAVPPFPSEEGPPANDFAPPIRFTDAFHDRLREQLSAWLDECTADTTVTPPGCPFKAAHPDVDTIRSDQTRYAIADIGEVTWEVSSYPEALPAAAHRDDRAFGLLPTQPGQVLLRGQAPPVGAGAAEPEAFEMQCAIPLRATTVTVEGPTEFSFRARPTPC